MVLIMWLISICFPATFICHMSPVIPLNWHKPIPPFVELFLNSNHHLNIIILTKNRLNSDSYYVSGEFLANITERTRVLDMVNIYSLPTQSKQFMQ